MTPEKIHGTDGLCFGQVRRYEGPLTHRAHLSTILRVAVRRLIDDFLQIGFSILAAVPETRNVYPLLGRAHDSLLPQHEEDP